MSFLCFLRERHVINQDLYDIVCQKASNVNQYIYDLLTVTGDFTETEIAKLKAEYYNLDYTDLEDFTKFDSFDYTMVEAMLAIPYKIKDNIVHIAIDDPDNLEAKDKINYCLSNCADTNGKSVSFHIAKKSEIMAKFDDITKAGKFPINDIITDAIKMCASDIHITPFEKTLKILFRVDGALFDYKTLHIDEFNKLAISLKVMSSLDISETRRPQSGHFQKNNIDFRLSTHPTTYGENIVIRLLSKEKALVSIENLGFSVADVNYLKKVSSLANGMIIFCGPTGSGKTTSIYSLLETMDKKSKNIMTLEDPVEYKISNVRQTEVIRGIIDFADGVRSILRQDPDVILIGEIRDEETAKMAIRASMTGHLVITTVHANDCFGAIARLREFNIQDSLIADNLITIISQRLIRKKSAPGRTIVSEILKIDRELSNLIYTGAKKNEMYDYASYKLNFRNMYDNCMEKIYLGEISEKDAASVLGTHIK